MVRQPASFDERQSFFDGCKSVCDRSCCHATRVSALQRKLPDDEDFSKKEASALVVTARKALQHSESQDVSHPTTDGQKLGKQSTDKSRIENKTKPVDTKLTSSKKVVERKLTYNPSSQVSKSHLVTTGTAATKHESETTVQDAKKTESNAPLSIIDKWLEKQKQDAPTYNLAFRDRMSRLQNIVPSKDVATVSQQSTTVQQAPIAAATEVVKSSSAAAQQQQIVSKNSSNNAATI